MTSTTLREMLVKQEPRSYSNCYVCSGPRAEYAVYSKPFRDNPFFPFLEHHQIPEGAEHMRSDGRVLTCLLCSSFLNQQWDCYEKSNVPYNKRIYWLKRLDGGPFAGMDVNLQQDYESLFEMSNAGMDTDCRPRTKSSSRSHQPPEMEVIRSKRSEQVDPLHFGFSNQVTEKQDSSSQNILDLSMPARTPASSVSPDLVECEVCYTCGEEAKTVLSIHVIPSHFVNFPSLASRPKPLKARPIDSEGKIHVCSHCHGLLMQQFECFQKQSIPHHERIYKVGVDLEQKEKSFVCYTCGMVSQLSVQRFINAYPERDSEPHYSFLLNVTPHAGAKKLTNGKAAVCSICYKSFFRQFQVYEVSKTPEEQRKYRTLNDQSVLEGGSVLRQHLETTVEQSKYECYLCETVTDSLFLINSSSSGDMYFPFIKDLSKPPNAIQINSLGQVKVCNQCHASLSYQWSAFEHAFIPINQRQYKIPVSKSKTIEKHKILHTKKINDIEHKFPVRRASKDLCSLCESPLTLETACFLETLPRENCMHFPSIRALVKPGQFSYADQYGRILACSQCFLILKNQYEVFESAHVPHAQRQYEIFSSTSERDRDSHFASDVSLSEAGAALHIQVSSPDLKVDMLKHSINAETLLTTVNTLPVSTFTISSSNISTSVNSPQPNDSKLISMKSSNDEPTQRICGPLDVPYVRPLVLVVPISCYICGELNSKGLMYPIRSQPINDKHSDDVPFFPFLINHALPDGAEKMSKDGAVLSCMFCYHSLVSQWLAYETSTLPEDSNRWLRRYNTHNYVCYICGITTYRKRACSISVKDFPFLLAHIRPAGALTLLNGECVVTCQTCFESITSQWKDFERMKVPVEMRKYNWIVMPAPLDDENSRGCTILQENSGSGEGFSSSDSNKLQVDEAGIPHGLKASHLSVPVPYSVAKPGGPLPGGAHPNTAFPPFPNHLNSALNATRTSSFAAALRKLAKQAVDPVTEKDLSPISPASSPASSTQQPSHGRHHALPMYLNNHNSNQPGRGSPSSAAPSIQGSQGKALDLGRYSTAHRNGEAVSLKMESSKLISSSNDKRNDIAVGGKHLGPPNLPPNLRQEHLTRGFQPYRNSDERRSTPPQMYPPSPPPTTMSGYPYHPTYTQSSRMPPQSYRMEESVYMERYGLLRPSTLPYPPPTNMIPHNRTPLYPANQYPPELIAQRSLPPNNSPYPPSNRYNLEEDSTKDPNAIRKREIELYREHERYLEREEGEARERELEYLRKERTHLRQSPLTSHHSASRSDTSADDKGFVGSITHGTPRDYARSSSPPSSTSTTPLNLATSVTHLENHLALKEEYSSRLGRSSSTAMNGQIIQRNAGHANSLSYRKENDLTPSYRMHYQENEIKPSFCLDTSDNAPPPHPKSIPYYSEHDTKKQDTVETRTLSIASVINSQINGIFARDKIASNKGHFPPAFYNRTHTPDNQKTEKMFAQQDAYHNEKQSTDNDSQYTPIESYKPKEESLVHLLMNPRSDGVSYENERFEEQMPRLVSVLDAREAKLKRLRKNSVGDESDESGIESDEEQDSRLRELLTITKGPPIKLEVDSKKSKFLSNLKLVTHSRRQALEIRKALRRQQNLCERSLSPLEESISVKDTIEYDPNHLAELSNRLCFSEDFQSKSEFLQKLKIVYLPSDKKAEKQRIQKIVLEERLRRNGILPPSQRCLELQGNLLRKRGCSILNGLKHAKKANTSATLKENSPVPVISENNGSLSKHSKTNGMSVQRLSSFLKPPMRTVNLPVPPLIPTYQVLSATAETTPEKNALSGAKDPRVPQFNKEFAKEFHNSVLQTTQMQLEKKNIPPTVPLELPILNSSSISSPEKSECSPVEYKPPFRWPGIEAIMESYECHISEQSVERKYLLESCQNLKALNEESTIKAECLVQRREELLTEKRFLESQQRELQSRFENLKLLFQRFR